MVTSDEVASCLAFSTSSDCSAMNMAASTSASPPGISTAFAGRTSTSGFFA
jgi:hypothetical protein